MTLKEMLKMWRSRVDDLVAPYLWSDADGVSFANAAENEACERAKLLLQNDPDSPICNIDGTLDATYTLDPRVIDVRSCTWGGHFLTRIDRETLNGLRDGNDGEAVHYGLNYGAYFQWNGIQDWSTLTGTPRFYMVEQERVLTLVRKPTTTAPIKLSVYRFPLDPMSLNEPERGPEIPERFHLHLIEWMEHLAYDNVDADKGDPKRAAEKEASFTKKFGERPDANVQRRQKERRSKRVRMNPDW